MELHTIHFSNACTPSPPTKLKQGCSVQGNSENLTILLTLFRPILNNLELLDRALLWRADSLSDSTTLSKDRQAGLTQQMAK